MEGRDRDLFEVFRRFPAGERKTTINVSYDSRPLGRDLKHDPPEYEERVPPIVPLLFHSPVWTWGKKKMLVNIASYRPEFEPTLSEYRIVLISTISPCSVVLPKKTVLAKNLNDATPLFVRKNSVRKCTKDRQLRSF